MHIVLHVGLVVGPREIALPVDNAHLVLLWSHTDMIRALKTMLAGKLAVVIGNHDSILVAKGLIDDRLNALSLLLGVLLDSGVGSSHDHH